MPYLDEYEQLIKDGKAVVGKWIKLNLKYIRDGLEEGRFFFDQEKADLKIRFIETICVHVKGKRGLVKLEPWQKYLIACIFGIVDKDGRRQFKEVVLVCGRKQGKSLLASSIQNAVLFTEPEPGMEIYNLAPKLQQANLIYDVAKAQIDAKECLNKRVRRRRSDIYVKATNSSMMPLAFSHKKSDGFNPYWVTYDEFAAWEGEASLRMYDVMLSGSGARVENPSIHFSCSTANYVDDGLYDRLMKRATAVLSGESHEQALFPLLYMIDDPQKWDDIDELRKALPNLGVSVPESFMRDEIVKAREDRAYYFEFLTKYCNLKQNSVSAWLTTEDLKATACPKLNPEDFRGCFGVGGVDLSQTTDLTAASIVIQKGGIDYCFTQFFMARDALRRLTDEEHVNYPMQVDAGNLTISGEKFIDYHDVVAWFEHMRTDYDIYTAVIGYDRYSAQYFVKELNNCGYETDDVIQGTNLTPIIDEAAGRIRSGLLKTGTNGLLQAHFKNACLEQNYNDKRVRITKLDDKRHIDGCVSVLDALTVRSKYWDKLSWRLMNSEGDGW